MKTKLITRETVLDAMDRSENYSSLAIRVSGCAVNFVRMTCEE
ncbi:MAG: glycine radical domain-containing protein [Sphingomonadaceae bacterium]